MKKIFLLLTFLITTFGFSQDSENDILYSLIINDKWTFNKFKTIVIKDSTPTGEYLEDFSSYKFDWIEKDLKGIQKETFDSFIEQNQKAEKLKINFKTKKKIIWLTDEEENEIFKKGEDGWENFYQNPKYRKSQGILIFSNIGFNKEKTQALLYYGNQSHWMSGAGYLILFEKINGKWKLSQSSLAWIS